MQKPSENSEKISEELTSNSFPCQQPSRRWHPPSSSLEGPPASSDNTTIFDSLYGSQHPPTTHQRLPAAELLPASKVERLSEKFPRLFNIVIDGECAISDCGTWDGLNWRWSIQWRRPLREWEEKMHKELLLILERKYYEEQQRTNGIGGGEWTKLIWRNLVPPNVEILI
ncbi:hypothetical protein PIB30_046889 [Stylosanthes scabra]|uniref:Uncharacterized protein n=1 Tax=Stylosanthes scabra TaxID=79078 RepID=A0ABU6TIJ9_9FABA|nr:hypothetical protein [Stylosanthes scabra]